MQTDCDIEHTQFETEEMQRSRSRMPLQIPHPAHLDPGTAGAVGTVSTREKEMMRGPGYREIIEFHDRSLKESLDAPAAMRERRYLTKEIASIESLKWRASIPESRKPATGKVCTAATCPGIRANTSTFLRGRDFISEKDGDC